VAEPPLTVVSLGSNLEPERHLPRAVAALAERLPLLRVSSAWATAAVGPRPQPPFLNAAVLLRSADPQRLKREVLRPVEALLGRVRTGDRFAPRTIDLDLVLHGDAGPSPSGLGLPDPDLVREVHLAVPAAEVLPDWRHPATGEPLSVIAERLLAALPAAARPRRLELPLLPS
jgi:2-amino-4-hydroxy-6-hydroxymethyldihydropteridine diphosphokinase